jgi:hypothetical protein
MSFIYCHLNFHANLLKPWRFPVKKLFEYYASFDGNNRGTGTKPPYLTQVTDKLYHILYRVLLDMTGIRTRNFSSDMH